MIYSKLHSDILYRGKKYTIFGSNNYKNTIPIFQLYDDWDGSPLLLLGEGGQGKTTNSKILQAELLYRQIPCFVFDSRQINSGVLKFTDAYPRDSVIIFDGWDEVLESVKEMFLEQISMLIKTYRVIVTSRYNPSELPTVMTEDVIFANFSVAEMCSFDTEQILQITDADFDVNSQLLELLSNTMYLSMYLSLNSQDRISMQNSGNSYQFIHKYFELLLANKEQKLTNIDKPFYDTGEMVYLMLAKKKTPFASNINSISALNNIIEEKRDSDGNWQIKTSHLKYKVFCLAVYLRYELLLFLNNDVRISEAFNQYFYAHYSEALILVGESLTCSELASLKAKIDYSGDVDVVRNFMLVLLGANNQCFDDEFFGLNCEKADAPVYKSFFIRNLCIKGLNFHHLKTLKGIRMVGLHNLQSIRVCDGHPTFKSQGNCLIRKKDNVLLIGCRKSVIPQGVRIIGKRAFSLCKDLRNIEIPSSVRKIEDEAFRFCWDLEELVIPDGVKHLGDNVILGCYNLKKLCIGSGLENISPKSLIIATDDLSVSFELQDADDARIPALTEIVMHPNDKYYSEGNCLIERNSMTVLFGCSASVIPNQIKNIGFRAFDSIKVDDLVLPNGLETIQNFAFIRAEFKKCVIPDTVREIGRAAFCECKCSDELEFPLSYKKIEAEMFLGAKINRLIIPKQAELHCDFGYAFFNPFNIDVNVFLRASDGSLLPPRYFGEMKRMGRSIFDEIISKTSADHTFDVVKSEICKEIVRQIDDTDSQILKYETFESEELGALVLKQKARKFLLKHLKESTSMENLYRRLE